MTFENKDFSVLLEKSTDILVVTPTNSSDDIIASSFAICNFVENKKRKVTLLFDDPIPEKLSFLSAPKKIVKNLSGTRDFLLQFNTANNKITKVETEEEVNKYTIRITPEKGTISPKDFSFSPASFNYDLLIVVGAPNFESLGNFYKENPDLFFEIPKINIDNQSSNENFGQVNIVEITASSIAEICTDLFLGKSENEKEIDHKISQALLTGIISATESFQKSTTTPKSMITAAKLMKYKADQPTIIRYLYKTKSLPFLKLWGRTMARLSWDKNHKCAWSLISHDDLARSSATQDEIPFILEEIQKNFSQGQIFAILCNESKLTTNLQIRFSNETIAKKFSQLYKTKLKNNSIKIKIEGKKLLEIEKEFLDNLKSI